LEFGPISDINKSQAGMLFLCFVLSQEVGFTHPIWLLEIAGEENIWLGGQVDVRRVYSSVKTLSTPRIDGPSHWSRFKL